MAAVTSTCCCCSNSGCVLPSHYAERKFVHSRPQCAIGTQNPSVAVPKAGEFRGFSVSSGAKKDCGRTLSGGFSDFTTSATRCSSRTHSSVSVAKLGDSRGFGASFSAKQDCGRSSRQSTVSCGDFPVFTASASASFFFSGTHNPGTRSHQNGATCSSSSCVGSSESSFFLGDCSHPRSSVRNGDVSLSSSFCSSRKKFSRRHRNGQGHKHHLSALRARAQEEAAIVKEIADLSESLLNLKGVVTTEYRSIGPEMRGRVERLYDRAVVLQQSADRAISSGSRMPTQLTANLISLQREHGSLENIVRLAMEASPALANLEAAVGTTSNNLSDAASNLLLEESKPKESFFQSLIRQSAIDPAAKSGSLPTPKYVMSAPASKGSSPLAAFRAEIERRVIEQLSGQKMTSKPVTSPISEGLLPTSNSSLPTSQIHSSDRNSALAEEQLLVETLEAPEKENGQLSVLSAEETAGTVALLEDKLKQLELELAKSIPLHVFEQKVEKISSALSNARAEVVQLTAEAAEKEAILAAVKKDLLAEQEQLTQKVRELTGDLDKMYSVEDIENAVNFGLADLEKELEEEQDRTFLLSVELEKKEKFLAEQQEKWAIMKEEMEQQLQKEQDRAVKLSLELETKEKQMIEQEEVWRVQRRALEADLKSKEETGLQLQKEQDRARSRILELETMGKQMTQQEEAWMVEKRALEADLKSKEETEQQFQLEKDRARSRILELETLGKQMTEQEEAWMLEKRALEADLRSREEIEQQLQKETDQAHSRILELEKKEKQLIEQEELWKVEKRAVEADLKSKEETEQQFQKDKDQARSRILELEKKEKQSIEQEQRWKVERSSLEADLKSKEATVQQLLKEKDQARSRILELETKDKQLTEQEELWKVEKRALEADLKSKEKTQQQFQKEQHQARSRISELETKEKKRLEQEERWKVEKSALEADLKSKEETSQQFQKETDRARGRILELETKEKQRIEQEEVWRVEKTALEADLKSKEQTEQQLQKEQDIARSRILELETKEKQLIEQEDLWKVQKRALEANLKTKEETQQQFQMEKDQALNRILELETNEKHMIEQEELWKVEKSALEADLKGKEDTDLQLQKEQDRALSLILELETKEKQMVEQEELWKVEKMAIEADLKSIQAKLQDVKKKRTKERSQLAEKKQKVKLLEQELKRLQESMQEADRIRLQKKEATYATVRMLITQMVQSSRARADSQAQASTLVEEVAKLQDENQTLEHSSKAAEEKAGQAEIEIEGIKASLAKVGREVANLQGEVPLGERAAALEKFFNIMAQLIKQVSENMEDFSSLEADFASENELLEDEDGEELQVKPVDSLASVVGAWDKDMEDQ